MSYFLLIFNNLWWVSFFVDNYFWRVFQWENKPCPGLNSRLDSSIRLEHLGGQVFILQSSSGICSPRLDHLGKTLLFLLGSSELGLFSGTLLRYLVFNAYNWIALPFGMIKFLPQWSSNPGLFIPSPSGLTILQHKAT